MRIDRIAKRPRTRLIDVYAGEQVVLTLGLETAQEAALNEGDELAAPELARLRYANDRRQAMNTGLRLLARRPRSEVELRQALRRKGFGASLIDETLARLRELGYIDDAAFAGFWTETRQASAPRSGRMLRWELRGKGIATEEAGEATAGVDDEEAAYRAIARRARSADRSDEARFRQRLSGFLQRRGFGWSTIQRAVDRLWAELAVDTDNEH